MPPLCFTAPAQPHALIIWFPWWKLKTPGFNFQAVLMQSWDTAPDLAAAGQPQLSTLGDCWAPTGCPARCYRVLSTVLALRTSHGMSSTSSLLVNSSKYFIGLEYTHFKGGFVLHVLLVHISLFRVKSSSVTRIPSKRHGLIYTQRENHR